MKSTSYSSSINLKELKKYDATFEFPEAGKHREAMAGLRDERIRVSVRGLIWEEMKDSLSAELYRQYFVDHLWHSIKGFFWVNLEGGQAEAECRQELEPIILQKLEEALNEMRGRGYTVNTPEGKIEISC